MDATENPSRIALLGGSFNPPHFGHMRLAVEVLEALEPDRLELIPCANPPHKDGTQLLPFELRAAMLEDSVRGWPCFRVSRVEAERSGPSYTADTLHRYRRDYPGAELFFVMGAEDFMGIRSWKDWQCLPALAQLLVVARQGVEAAEFARRVLSLWPEAKSCPGSELCPELPPGLAVSFSLPGLPLPARGHHENKNRADGLVHYLHLPRLDISSSLIRQRWLEARSIDFWVPEAVIGHLGKNNAAARRHWQEEDGGRHA